MASITTATTPGSTSCTCQSDCGACGPTGTGCLCAKGQCDCIECPNNPKLTEKATCSSCDCEASCAACGPSGSGCQCPQGQCACPTCVNKELSLKCACKSGGECICTKEGKACTCT